MLKLQFGRINSTCKMLALLLLCAGPLALSGCSPRQAPQPQTSANPQVQGNNQPAPAQPVEEFAPDGSVALTKNFYFVFDGSGSMSYRLDEAKWAVREFLKSIPDDVNLGLYVFDYQGQREVVPLAAGNRAAFLAEVDKVRAGGGTPLGDAITIGAHSLNAQYKQQLGYGEYRLIVVTDGDASDNLDRGVKTAQDKKIPIYTIGFGIGQRHALRQHSVSYRSADSAEELKKALEEAASELDVFDPANFQKN